MKHEIIRTFPDSDMVITLQIYEYHLDFQWYSNTDFWQAKDEDGSGNLDSVGCMEVFAHLCGLDALDALEDMNRVVRTVYEYATWIPNWDGDNEGGNDGTD